MYNWIYNIREGYLITTIMTIKITTINSLLKMKSLRKNIHDIPHQAIFFKYRDISSIDLSWDHPYEWPPLERLFFIELITPLSINISYEYSPLLLLFSTAFSHRMETILKYNFLSQKQNPVWCYIYCLIHFIWNGIEIK